YLATAALFRNRIVGRFLAACGAIPVHRKEDPPPAGGAGLADPAPRAERNAGTFAACREAFERGRVVAIYPEGTTHAEARGGRVLVSFGPPVPVTPYLAAYRADAAKGVEALTTAIQWAMEAEVVHVERIEARDLVRAVEELYRGDLVRELMEARGLAPDRIDL